METSQTRAADVVISSNCKKHNFATSAVNFGKLVSTENEIYKIDGRGLADADNLGGLLKLTPYGSVVGEGWRCGNFAKF